MNKTQIAFYIVVLAVIACNMWKMDKNLKVLKKQKDEEERRIKELREKGSDEEQENKE